MSRIDPKLYLDLIGAPYVEGGRGPSGYDCLGLAIELQRRQGRPMPDFRSTAEELAAQYGAGVLGPCFQIPRVQPGCAVLFRMFAGEHHIATMIDSFRMLHTLAKGRGGAGAAVIEQLGWTPWERRVLGFYVPVGEPAK